MNTFTNPQDIVQHAGQQAIVPDEKVKAKPTLYSVYATKDDGLTLVFIDDATAANDIAALKRAVPSPDPDLRYAAIPARSVRLRGGTAESKPVVKFS